jgi:anti-sigma factor RsiW
MSGRIISLHGDLHDDACALLPWYVTGRLDAEDAARVEAHLPTCAQCQADLAAERRLQAALSGLETPIGSADAGFAALSARLSARPPRLRARIGRIGQQWQGSAPWLRWAVAAQLALLVLGGAALVAGHLKPTVSPQYRTLGAAPVSPAANVVVVFRPDVRESDLRRALRDSHARLVDGPTAADGYLLHVDPAGRASAVEELRHDKAIVLAEPIDSGDKP